MNSTHDLEGKIDNRFYYEATVEVDWDVQEEGFSYEFWGEVGYHQVWVPAINDYYIEHFSVYDDQLDEYVEQDNEEHWLKIIYNLIEDDVFELEPPYV